MGIDHQGARLLLFCKRLGVDFSAVATIGRQGLYLEPSHLQRIFSDFGRTLDDAALGNLVDEGDGFAEGLFRVLGAQCVDAFDLSAYEGATHVHDMNLAVDKAHHGKYSLVLDGGSLEHVFQVATALRNCMEMVRVGGHFVSIAPANNFFGHGFYQFSPEFYFRALSRANGFEVLHMFAVAPGPAQTWYRVRDPAHVHERVTLTGPEPVYLLVVARRVAGGPLFSENPQQSDYATLWGGSPSEQERTSAARFPAPPTPEDMPRSRNRVAFAASATIRKFAQRFRGRWARDAVAPGSRWDPRFFQPYSPETAPIDPAHLLANEDGGR